MMTAEEYEQDPIHESGQEDRQNIEQALPNRDDDRGHHAAVTFRDPPASRFGCLAARVAQMTLTTWRLKCFWTRIKCLVAGHRMGESAYINLATRRLSTSTTQIWTLASPRWKVCSCSMCGTIPAPVVVALRAAFEALGSYRQELQLRKVHLSGDRRYYDARFDDETEGMFLDLELLEAVNSPRPSYAQ
jgi:hypothetical protein